MKLRLSLVAKILDIFANIKVNRLFFTCENNDTTMCMLRNSCVRFAKKGVANGNYETLRDGSPEKFKLFRLRD